MFHKFFLPLVLFLSFLLVFSAGSQAFPGTSKAEKDKYVTIRLLPEKTQAKGGETITVGIHHKIHPGWHTYWVNAGDSGSAAKVKWEGLKGIEAASIQWPVPKRLPMGPLMNFGYEDEVILLQNITLPKDLSDAPQEIKAEIDVLVCHEICIPESHTASFTINGDEEAVPAAIEMARTQLPIDMGWQSQLSQSGGDIMVNIATDAPSAFGKLKTIELYPEDWGLIANTAKTDAALKNGKLILTHQRGERAISETPVTKMVIAYEDAKGVRKAVRISALADTIAPAPIQSERADIGFIKAILLAFIGGLILNLMPCVFPVLSMKALSLVQLKDKESAKARMQGIAYTLGILASFALIAGLLLVLKAGGMQVGWGFQLQHPAVILFLTYMFFTLGLNLAGYFEFHLPFANAGQSFTQKSGMTGSFFTGVLATLVATPCTAPFMGVAMGYALTQGPVLSMLIFLSLGIGLAFPYLALTFFPPLRHILPKPGAWMETFRQFLAFPMFAAACWLFWVLSQQIGHMGQFAALLGMLFIAFGIWLYRARPSSRLSRILVFALSITAFAFTLGTFFMMKPMEAASTQELTLEKGDNWEAFTDAKLDEYLEGNDPVFINMTAAWCITCKVNEKVALNTEATQKLFSDKGIKYLKGDWTNQNPEITNFLEGYGRSGVPIYVYYGPRDAEDGTRPDAVVLPQILTPGVVEKTINF